MLNQNPGRRDPTTLRKFVAWTPRCVAACALALALTSSAATNLTSLPGWLTQPLSLPDAISVALKQNGDILKAASDLEAAHGIAVQTRAIVLPKLRGAAEYRHDEAVENEPRSKIEQPDDQWGGSIRVIQSIYEGGRLRSALRAARLTRDQALLDYETVVANTLLDLQTAYYDVLLAEQHIVVRDASVTLLQEQLAKTKRQYDAGAVPQFDVLRAEVEVANALPKLIRARNAHRIAKNNLGTLLGYNIPTNVWDDIPLTLTTKLTTQPYNIELPVAIALARAHRTELSALQAELDLQRERLIAARSGYKPSVGVFAGYSARSSEFRDDFYHDVSGPMAGVSMTWDFFDGFATQGRITEARARELKASVNLEENTRRIEQQVRSAYSSFVEAREVMESQRKVVEQAEEALRLAGSRYEAGSGTQLDVLNAQTALTEARTTQVESAHDYLVARARLDRAIGVDITAETPAVRKP
jgi:TolC family type I secretion outer membrane protein